MPQDADGLRRALSRVHRNYAGTIHARQKRTGHFWQGRFGAVARDEAQVAAAVRYVLLNPVRARLVARLEDWPWSAFMPTWTMTTPTTDRVGRKPLAGP